MNYGSAQIQNSHLKIVTFKEIHQNTKLNILHSKMIKTLLVSACTVVGVNGFYLPGVAPKEFAEE